MIRYVINASMYFICLWLASCSATQDVLKPTYFYNEIVLRNESNRDVSDVTIKVKNTGGVFSCSIVLSRSECSNKTPKRKYLGNPITITWRFTEQNYTQDEVRLNIPNDFSADAPLRGVLVIENSGKIKTYFEQDKLRKASSER